MNKIQCPACDSYNVTVCEKQGIAQAVYGTEVPYNEKVIKCNDCESSFVDNTIAVDPYSKALEQSKKESVTCILDSLSQLGTNLAAMERALELPQRTLSRWKSGADPSAAGLTLLRFINTYPWLLEVADAKYDITFANMILINQAQNVFKAMCNSIGLKQAAQGGLIDQDNIFVYSYYNRDQKEANNNFIPYPTESANAANTFNQTLLKTGS